MARAYGGMKALLVQPRFSRRDVQPYPPFGLVTLAPYFDSEVQICDLNAGDQFEKSLRWNPDVVGFTAFTSQLTQVDSLARIVKQKTDAKTMAGGPGVTVTPENAEKILSHIDLLVAGDGEYFAEHLDAVNWENRLFRSPFFDFEDHKIPIWNKVDYKRYLRYPGLAVETSRGCPFNCIWCCAHLVTGKKWRPRKPIDIVEEIKFLHKKYRCKKFYFSDDNATVDPKRWVNLMQRIVDAQLGVKFHVPEGIQAHHLDRETLLLMKEAGFQMITIGAESGVQRVLDKVIDKGGLKVEQIENVVRTCTEIGLGVNCFFVIGAVGETYDEAKATVEFAQKLRKLGAYNCIVNNAKPIPGTRMFDIAKKKGYLTVPTEMLYRPNSILEDKHLLETPEWTPEQIEDLLRKARQQDARHTLGRKKTHVLKKGLPRLFRHPTVAIARLKQLLTEAK